MTLLLQKQTFFHREDRKECEEMLEDFLRVSQNSSWASPLRGKESFFQ
jgi:hypothetical protein